MQQATLGITTLQENQMISQSVEYFTYSVKAKEKNNLLNFTRCHYLYKGESYFKTKKEEEYYRKYCQSLPVRKASKSQMYKSEITNVSSIHEDRPLHQLNELSARTNLKKNRPPMF